MWLAPIVSDAQEMLSLKTTLATGKIACNAEALFRNFRESAL
jgi:hypothetical protein